MAARNVNVAIRTLTLPTGARGFELVKQMKGKIRVLGWK